ncbi:hypothetical protein GF359_10445 [candidate division WOR-3 bacterium]|uniref:Uncharacterized protein n=1 Tax=candidate division WOR-3 bacterium TaxID=2052148 RepID=A0A9D5KCK8_UNCW3|nr:hypothetical protein [candidate division WOR-3 bacterium]MBD3365620.1 hypothetical protein [candidate division WOR-3 bacterium]
MPKSTKLAVAAIAVLTAIFATVILAGSPYDFDGDATGDWGNLQPFSPWEGTLDSASNTITGFWGNDNSGNQDIYGQTSYSSITGHYTVGGVTQNGTWKYSGTVVGGWEGYFDPYDNGSSDPDTAEGTWWVNEDPESYNGDWFGDLEGD